MVPIPRVVTVATPTVKSAISTSASGVSDAAVDAVPVIPPIKLDAETAFAVIIPTLMFGVPTRDDADDATPVRDPSNLVVAVIIPD